MKLQRFMRPLLAMRRALLPLALGALVAWTVMFLSVHELSHLKDLDSSSCPISLITATFGGASVHAGFALHAPLIETVPYYAVPVQSAQSVPPSPQARAPPEQA